MDNYNNKYNDQHIDNYYMPTTNDMYVHSNRYDDDRFYDMYDMRYDDMYYDNRRYDPYGGRRNYYQYPFCDRYGRCVNPLWMMFWPFFFM